jgi:16S rRNA (guanine527-N7)-methyltransferase
MNSELTQIDSLLPEMNSVWQETLNWQPDAQQQSHFQRLYELILVGNRQLNLTRITEPEDFWEKHLWDSLRGVQSLLNPKSTIPSLTLIDIGTGAGFPGIPAAIALPSATITLLDATRKKIAFLETLLAELDIKNATTLVGRSEEIGKQPKYRQTYDLALVRAVGSASVCAKYALPLLKLNGLAILYRGQWTEDDTKALQADVTQLGATIESIEEFTTPITNSIRHCLYLRKI